MSRKWKEGQADQPQRGKARSEKASAPVEQMSQYFFTFEMTKQYPMVRSFIVKMPLKRSLKDTLGELFSGGKKGAYKI
jgi:hypothetical protein